MTVDVALFTVLLSNPQHTPVCVRCIRMKITPLLCIWETPPINKTVRWKRKKGRICVVKQNMIPINLRRDERRFSENIPLMHLGPVNYSCFIVPTPPRPSIKVLRVFSQNHQTADLHFFPVTPTVACVHLDDVTKRRSSTSTSQTTSHKWDRTVCSSLIMNRVSKIEPCVLFLSLIHRDDSLLTSLRWAAPLHWWPSRDAPKTSTMHCFGSAPLNGNAVFCSASVHMQLRADLVVVLSKNSEKKRQMDVRLVVRWMESLLLHTFVSFVTDLLSHKNAGCIVV